MTVLVTGGTGFVGGAIVRELRSAGHGARILSRGDRSRDGMDQVPGNVLDAGSLDHACSGVDGVIHLVGIISEVGEQTFENVHTRGTHNMIAAAQRAGVKRFVHMSALGSRPNAAARYHQSKWAAEEKLRESGLDWTIFRPSIIYGPGDGFVNLFAKIIRRSPIVPIIGNGQTKFQPIAVENVARAFVDSLTKPKAIGQTFDLCGAETLTMDEIVDAILAVTKRKRLKLHLPPGLVRLQAAMMEWFFGRLLRRPPPLNRDQVVMLQEDHAGNPQPANELFGLKHGSFREGLSHL